jgi:hypothetical protein
MARTPSRARVALFLAAGVQLLVGCVGDLTGGDANARGSGGDGGGTGAGDGTGAGGSGGGSDGSGSGAGSDGAEPGGDAGGGGAATGCDGSAVLCDDFEDAAPGGPPDPARWTVATPDCAGTGSLAVDGAEAHTGARSVRIDGAGGYCNHIFIGSDAIAGVAGAVHGRFWIRLADALGDGHVTFMAMRDAAADSDVRMGGQSSILMWNRERDDATLPELSPAGIGQTTPLTAGAWTCIELAVDGAAGTIATSVDGTAIAGLVVDGAPTPDIDAQWLRDPSWRPDLADIRLGWESYAGQPMTLWVDDVAFGPDPLGCD